VNVRAVLLDAAGTLIETREPVGETYARVARAHGAEIAARRLDEAFRRAMADAPALVFPGAAAEEIGALERRWWVDRVRATFLCADAPMRPDDFEKCFETLYAHFARPDAWSLRAGAHQALAELRARGLGLAIVSNFDRRLRAVLAGLEVADYFDCVVLPSDVGAEKPSPEIFRRALEILSVAPAEAVFVGDDSVKDSAGARALGMSAIEVGALATLAALPAAIDELMEGSV
jgi:putative hydrolase of the HAD superfamily